MKSTAIAERVNANSAAPITRGATSASTGKWAGSGSPGAAGSSRCRSRGRPRTRGDRMKAISVLAPSARVGPVTAMVISVAPSWATSPCPRTLRETRIPPTRTPFAEFSSRISTCAPMLSRACLFDTMVSLRRTSQSAARPIVTLPDGRLSCSPVSGPAVTVRMAAAGRDAPSCATDASSTRAPDRRPESISATPGSSTTSRAPTAARRVRSPPGTWPANSFAPASVWASVPAVVVASAVTRRLRSGDCDPGWCRVSLSFTIRLPAGRPERDPGVAGRRL